MGFLNPTYLWTLLGLFIPLAIHFWSNKTGKIIKVGNTKFLQTSDVPQSSSLQLNEYILLLLRLLIITIVVLILAEPIIQSNKNNVPITYIIEESLLGTNQLTKISNEFEEEADIRILKKGLPIIEANDMAESNKTHSKNLNYWSFVKSFEALETDSLVIITNGYLTGLEGKRPKTKKDVRWLVLNMEDNVQKDVAIIGTENDYQILKASISSSNLVFNKQPISTDEFKIGNRADSARNSTDLENHSIPLNKVETIRVGIKFDQSLDQQARIFEGAFASISTYLSRPISIEYLNNPSNGDLDKFYLIVWLSNENLPETKSKIIELKKNEISNELLVRKHDMHYQLSKLLNTEIIIEQHFSEKMISILNLNENILSHIDKFDLRSVSESEIQTIYSKDQIAIPTESSFNVLPWLLTLLIVLFLIERLLSRKRNQ